jgi:hypothetical protein
MKKKFLFMLIVLLTFSFAFIACDDADEFDPDLTGTWVDAEGYTIDFDGKGGFTGSISFEELIPIKFKGTYETNGDKITMTATNISIDNGTTWLDKAQITIMAAAMGEYEGLILEMLEPQTNAYKVEGNKLTLGGAEYTRKK